MREGRRHTRACFDHQFQRVCAQRINAALLCDVRFLRDISELMCQTDIRTHLVGCLARFRDSAFSMFPCRTCAYLRSAAKHATARRALPSQRRLQRGEVWLNFKSPHHQFDQPDARKSVRSHSVLLHRKNAEKRCVHGTLPPYLRPALSTIDSKPEPRRTRPSTTPEAPPRWEATSITSRVRRSLTALTPFSSTFTELHLRTFTIIGQHAGGLHKKQSESPHDTNSRGENVSG